MSRKLVVPVGLLLIELFVTPAAYPAEFSKYPPCYSIRESKLRGYYLYAVSFEPNVIMWKGKEIKIKEAWIEQAHEQLLIGSKRTSHYNMCLTLSTGWDALSWIRPNPRPPVFVLEGKENSFRMMWSTVLWETFDKIESEEFNVFVTDNWDFDGAIKIKVKATKVATSQKKQ